MSEKSWEQEERERARTGLVPHNRRATGRTSLIVAMFCNFSSVKSQSMVSLLEYTFIGSFGQEPESLSSQKERENENCSSIIWVM